LTDDTNQTTTNAGTGENLVGFALQLAAKEWQGDTDEEYWRYMARAALDAAPPPELWSIHEAAEYLGRTRQRVDQLVSEYMEALEPIYVQPGGRGTRIWLAYTWRRFATSGAWNQVTGRTTRALPREDTTPRH